VRKVFPLILLGVLLATGVAGSVATMANRELDPAFEFRARNPLRVEPEQVERAVMNAPEPAAEGPKTKARSARCKAGTTGDLRNPWTCAVRYASGARFSYEVEVDADGAFEGQTADGQRLISGCCVEAPSAE
jgi:hypothetical protein